MNAYNPIVAELVTNLVQHPIPIEPPLSGAPEEPRPMMMTAKEQKRLRRQNRLLVQQEKQDRVRLGLAEPDQPRLTKSNFMRVLGGDAIMAPSKVEQMVATQIVDRRAKHLQHNSELKLTPEEKKAKKERKLHDDLSNTTVSVCVFK